MNVLVVFCHPERQSFMGAALECALAGLSRTEHDVRVIDLYDEGFRPELSREERSMHSVDKRQQSELLGDLRRHADNLTWAQALLLVYPTWWAGQPAMLKGWFDRVLVCGIAWHMPGGSTRVRPLLRHIRHLVVVTSHGSTKWVNALEGEGGKRTVTRSLRLLCNPRCRTRWIALYNIDRAAADTRQAFLARVERKLSRL